MKSNCQSSIKEPPTHYYYIYKDEYGKLILTIATKKQLVDEYGKGHRHHRTDDQIFDFVQSKLSLKVWPPQEDLQENLHYLLDI